MGGTLERQGGKRGEKGDQGLAIEEAHQNFEMEMAVRERSTRSHYVGQEPCRAGLLNDLQGGGRAFAKRGLARSESNLYMKAM